MKKQILFTLLSSFFTCSFAAQVPSITAQNRQGTYTAQTAGKKNHQIIITDANNIHTRCDLGDNTARIKHIIFDQPSLQLHAITKGGKVIYILTQKLAK